MNRWSKLRRIASCLRQAHSPTAREMDLRGRSYLVTGGSSGMGAAIAQTLARWGGHALVACRTQSKGEALAEDLRSRYPGTRVAVFGGADTSDLGSMRALAEKVRSAVGSSGLDGLILNAGIARHPYARSAQGYELHCATNVLGHHLLMRALLPRLAESESGRVVYVVGELYLLARDCTLDFTYEFPTLPAYARSKLGVLWNALTLHEHRAQLGAPQVASIGVHPGVVATAMIPGPDWLKGKLLLSPERGAQTTLRAATDPDIASGSYVHNTRGVVDLAALELPVTAARRLEFWEECERAVAPYLDEARARD